MWNVQTQKPENLSAQQTEDETKKRTNHIEKHLKRLRTTTKECAGKHEMRAKKNSATSQHRRNFQLVMKRAVMR